MAEKTWVYAGGCQAAYRRLERAAARLSRETENGPDWDAAAEVLACLRGLAGPDPGMQKTIRTAMTHESELPLAAEILSDAAWACAQNPPGAGDPDRLSEQLAAGAGLVLGSLARLTETRPDLRAWLETGMRAKERTLERDLERRGLL